MISDYADRKLADLTNAANASRDAAGWEYVVRHRDELDAYISRLEQENSRHRDQLVTIGEIGVPSCPKCGSEDGALGTQCAYFVCGPCGTERYWTPDFAHPGDWDVAVMASPWARPRVLQERIRRLELAEKAMWVYDNEHENGTWFDDVRPRHCGCDFACREPVEVFDLHGERFPHTDNCVYEAWRKARE